MQKSTEICVGHEIITIWYHVMKQFYVGFCSVQNKIEVLYGNKYWKSPEISAFFMIMSKIIYFFLYFVKEF